MRSVLRTGLLALSLCVLLLSNTAAFAQNQRPKGSGGRIRIPKFVAKQVGPEWTPLAALTADSADIPTVEGALDSRDPMFRQRAAFLLGQVRSKSSIPLLVKHLSDGVPSVRTQCGIALACLEDERGIPQCKIALETGPDWIRYYAAFALWCVNTPEARAVLESSPSAKNDFIRGVVKAADSPRAVKLPDLIASKPGHKKMPVDDIWQAAANKLVNEGDWWYHWGEYDQIVRTQEAALLFDPTFVDLYSTNAWLLWSMGRTDEADSELLRGTAAVPQSWESHFELGRHYFQTKRYALAEPELRKSLILNGPILARRIYAHCLEKMGKAKAALSQWQTIAKAVPGDPAAALNRDRLKRLLEEK